MNHYEQGYLTAMKVAQALLRKDALVKVGQMQKEALNERLLRRLLDSEGLDGVPRELLEKYRKGDLWQSDYPMYQKIQDWAEQFSPDRIDTAMPEAPYEKFQNLGEAAQGHYYTRRSARNAAARQRATDVMTSGRHSADDVVDIMAPGAQSVLGEPNRLYDPENRAFRGYTSGVTKLRSSVGARDMDPDAPRWVTAHPEIAQIYADVRHRTPGTGHRYTNLVPGRIASIDEVSLSRIPESRRGVWTPNVTVDTRGMSPAEIEKLPRQRVSYWDLPDHEMVLGNQDVDAATVARWKNLPSGEWMRVMNKQGAAAGAQEAHEKVSAIKEAISTKMLRRLQGAGRIPDTVSAEDIMAAMRRNVWDDVPDDVRVAAQEWAEKVEPAVLPFNQERLGRHHSVFSNPLESGYWTPELRERWTTFNDLPLYHDVSRQSWFTSDMTEEKMEALKALYRNRPAQSVPIEAMSDARMKALKALPDYQALAREQSVFNKLQDSYFQDVEADPRWKALEGETRSALRKGEIDAREAWPDWDAAIAMQEARRHANEHTSTVNNMYNLMWAEEHAEMQRRQALLRGGRESAREEMNDLIQRYEDAYVTPSALQELEQARDAAVAGHPRARQMLPRTLTEEGVVLGGEGYAPDARWWRSGLSTANVPPDDPRWVTAHPDIALGYATGKPVEDAFATMEGDVRKQLSPDRKRVFEYDAERVPAEKQGPWHRHLAKDTRNLSEEEAQAATQSAGKAEWGASPTYEKVVTESALRDALKRRWKPLPGGGMMELEDFSKTGSAEKGAASALRKRIRTVFDHDPHEAGRTTARMFLNDKEIGTVGLRHGEWDPEGFAVARAEIDYPLRGMGLGTKMYGDIMRQLPGGRLESGRSVSNDAIGVWEKLRKNPSYNVEVSPDSMELPHPVPGYIGRKLRPDRYEEVVDAIVEGRKSDVIETLYRGKINERALVPKGKADVIPNADYEPPGRSDFGFRMPAKHASALKDKDIELWEQWKLTKSPYDLQNLMQQMDPVIQAEVNKWSGAIARPVLEAHAKKLALEAFETYNPNMGAALNTHLTNRLKKLSRKVYTHQDAVRVPEYKKLQFNSFMKGQDELMSVHGREPTTVELADHLGWSPKAVQSVQRSMSSELIESSDMGAGLFETKSVWGTHEDAMVDLVYYDLDPTDKIIFEHSTGYGGKRILSNDKIMQKTGLTQGQLSYRKRKIIDRLQDVLD